MDATGNILCCFLAQFDNKAGPLVTEQAPAGYLTAAAFDEISRLVIPKPFLCGSLVSVARDGATVLAVPVLLRHARYHRNALLFALGFVVRHHPAPYHPLLHKLAHTLRTMEQESAFVSSGLGLPIVASLCLHLLHALNTAPFLAEFTLDPGNTLHLQLQAPSLPLPPLPPPHAVPVALVPLARLDSSDWDLSVVLAAQWIDGVRCVRDIAKEAKADVPVVAQAVRTLLAFHVVSLTQPPLASSRYACTSKASTFYFSPLGKACCQALGIASSGLPRVALLYARMKPSETFVETLNHSCFPFDNPPFDVQRFVMFGLLNNIIRRVQPFLFPNDNADKAISVDQYLVQEGLPLDDGHFEKTLKRFEANPDYTIIWK